jgi:hypothetical protein
MKRTPEQVAWIVLLASFFLFCFIVVAVPLSVRWYVLHAEQGRQATVEALAGTVVVEPPTGRGPTPLGEGQRLVVPEGTAIRLDRNSEATVTFFDHSFMRLFEESSVRLDRLRTPRYAVSSLPNSVRLYLAGGRVQIGTAISLTAPLDFIATTPQGELHLAADGSYALEATNTRSDLVVYRGQAHAIAAGVDVSVSSSQRTQITFNSPPQPPTGMARNLLTNGGFQEPLSQGWRVFNDQGADGGNIDGQVDVVVDEGQRAAEFTRTGGQGNHCETVLEQSLDQKLPDQASSLVVRAMVKVRYQSLSGGGYLSSEYPLMIRLTYRDVYDSETEWVQGFYYENETGNPTMYGLQIPQDRWYYFESENLLEKLPIRPFRVMRLRVYASGWDYESLISDINLVVE